MEWSILDTWIVTAGLLCAVSCALLGNYLVLRKMSMMGDAISHAVLPGLAGAFLLTGSRSSIWMFIGAAGVGVLTAVCTRAVHRYGRVDEGASMGVVFTILFALGLIMIVRGAHAVDLDPACVLYGAIELTPLDTVTLLGITMPRAVWVLTGLLSVNVLFVGACYKELKISSFDEDLATAQGFHAGLIHYALMTLVAITIVASFESVGSILVIAMLIVPPATAYLLTDRMFVMILLSLVIAAACAIGGHMGAVLIPPLWGYSDTSTASVMAVVAGLFFVLACLISPKHGMVRRVVNRCLLNLRISREDVLGLLYRMEELSRAPHERELPDIVKRVLGMGRLKRRMALRALERRGSIRRADGRILLTDSGRDHARHIIRAHRLWEVFLFKYLNLPVDRLHPAAERLEHITDARMRDLLAEDTGRPAQDPQGRDIPS